jgi:hypothetical protein
VESTSTLTQPQPQPQPQRQPEKQDLPDVEAGQGESPKNGHSSAEEAEATQGKDPAPVVEIPTASSVPAPAIQKPSASEEDVPAAVAAQTRPATIASGAAPERSTTPPPQEPSELEPLYVPADEEALAGATDDAAIHKRGKFTREDYEHRGFVLTADLGAMGCTKSVCARGGGLDSAPGVRVGGFLGGNIAGIVELGVAGAWGKVTPSGVAGRSLLDVYGIEAAQASMMAEQLDFDLSSLIIDSAESANGRGGIALRVHFIPKGRVTAYVGSGVGYSLYRTRFATQLGGVRLDFHGIDVPIQGGVAFYVHPKIALAGQFDYMWTHYVAVYGETPTQQAAAPMGPVDDQLEEMGDALSGKLPHFWTATIGLRVTL